MASKTITIKWTGITNAIDSDVYLKDSLKNDEFMLKRYKARWDTGATKSAIGNHIVGELGLKTVSTIKAYGVDGEFKTGCYYVDIIFPNQLRAVNILVTGGNFKDQPFDMLIGMDIISMGDFAITNYNNETVFSFRCPSMSQIDFVNHSYDEPYRKTAKEFGRNDKCPCGSGKKYKQCCGKT